MQGGVLRVAQAVVRRRGERLLRGAALVLAPIEVMLDQQGVRLLVGAGGHRLAAGEKHPAIAGAGQRTGGATAHGLLEVVEAQGGALEKFDHGQADGLLTGQAVDPLGGKVEEAHPRFAVTEDDRLAETVEQRMQGRGFQECTEHVAADVHRGAHAHFQGWQEGFLDHGCNSLLCRAARSTATFQATPSCMRIREQWTLYSWGRPLRSGSCTLRHVRSGSD